jgi:hypothetical protein
MFSRSRQSPFILVCEVKPGSDPAWFNPGTQALHRNGFNDSSGQRCRMLIQ